MANKSRLKIIIKGLAGFVIIASFVFIFLIILQLKAKKEIASSYAELPSLELKGIDDDTIILNEEYQNEKVLLIIYSSECSFCMEEVREVFTNHSKFTKINIVMATREDRKSIHKLSRQYGASRASNIKLTFSENANTIDWMANFKVPSIFIYNSDHKLIKHFEGKTSVSEILKYI